MACLNITPGLFFNGGPTWTSGNATQSTANGATVTNTAGGPSPGCLVEKGASSEFFTQPPGGSTRFLVFGTPANFVAVLLIQGGVGPVQRTVIIVDVSGSAPEASPAILTISADSSVQIPQVDPSPGNGSLCMVSAPDGSGPLSNIHALICRSQDGEVLCGAIPFHATLQVVGNTTTTEVQVLEGSTVRASAALPRGDCEVTPDPLNFPDAVVGPGVAPALSTSVRTETIRNEGNDCLVVNSITGIAPYSFSASVPALPVTLDPGDEVEIDIRFSATAVGTFNVDLPINPTPAVGDTLIRCRGEARAPVVSIGFPGTRAFGTIPVATSSSMPLVISNTGEVAVTGSIPGSPPGSEFTWAAATFNLAPGASAPSVPITFSPVVEGLATRTLTFTSSTPASPHSVALSGTGCVARARIVPVVPPGPQVDFGNVQRGFRMVRVVRVQNPGNAVLTFRARTTGNALFGIQRAGDSITSPLAEAVFTVAPPSSCGAGPTGPGQVEFAVTFFADAVPGPQDGTLVIDNHNDTTGVPASFTFPLHAEVIAVINADVELVIDRSGSMHDASGPRRKIDVALDAARLFIQLGRPDADDRIGTARFNTVPETVQSITAITTGNQAALVGGITEANFPPDGGTSIAGGILQAVADLAANPRTTDPPELNRAIVVLTDANDNTPYLNPADNVSYTLLGESGTTAVPVPAGIRLYGVGIGDDVDTGRLAQLCPTTGGDFLHVHDFSGLDFFKLEKHFTQIYMATVNLAQISDPTFWIPPNSRHEHTFGILRGDVSFMVVLFDRDGIRLPFWLQSPQGELIELTSVPSGFQIRPGITTTARFLEVRLPQGEPERYAGEWRVIIAHDGKQCFLPGLPAAASWTGQSDTAAPAIHAASHLAGTSNDQTGPLSYGFTSSRCKKNDVDPVMYGIAIGAGSNFRMFPFIEPGIVRVGDPIRLNALVSEFSLPVLGAEVTVAARAPSGTTFNLTLVDDGSHQDGDANDGDYGGTFTHAYEQGMYEFLFRTHGLSRDGELVTREATLSKYVEGRDKLVPEGGGGTRPDPKDPCCSALVRGLRVITILLILILLVLIWMNR